MARDESQDMWIFEDGGDCLGVVEYEGRLTEDGEELFEEGERYVRFSDLEQALELLKLADSVVESLRGHIEFNRLGAEGRTCTAAEQLIALDAYDCAKRNSDYA